MEGGQRVATIDNEGWARAHRGDSVPAGSGFLRAVPRGARPSDKCLWGSLPATLARRHLHSGAVWGALTLRKMGVGLQRGSFVSQPQSPGRAQAWRRGVLTRPAWCQQGRPRLLCPDSARPGRQGAPPGGGLGVGSAEPAAVGPRGRCERGERSSKAPAAPGPMCSVGTAPRGPGPLIPADLEPRRQEKSSGRPQAPHNTRVKDRGITAPGPMADAAVPRASERFDSCCSPRCRQSFGDKSWCDTSRDGSTEPRGISPTYLSPDPVSLTLRSLFMDRIFVFFLFPLDESCLRTS